MRRADFEVAIRKYPAKLQRLFRMYAAFVLRYRVVLCSSSALDVNLVPILEELQSGEQKAVLRDGRLQEVAAIKRQSDGALMLEKLVRSSVASDTDLVARGMSVSEARRLKETINRRGLERYRLPLIHLTEEATPDCQPPLTPMTELLDRFYDPTTITSIIVKSRKQPYLVCLVGELATADEWSAYASVRTELHKAVYRVSAVGRPGRRKKQRSDLLAASDRRGISQETAFNRSTETQTQLESRRKALYRARNRAKRVRESLLQN